MNDNRQDDPLPATALFVTGLGIFLVVVWALMFALMTSRW
jgi:hypothetical protein